MKSFVLYMAMIAGTGNFQAASSGIHAPSVVLVKELPAKTICIKHPMANDANSFFSTTTNLFFEVHKPGSKADFTAILDKLKQMEGVQNVTPGNITGDFFGVNLSLKGLKDKAWFIQAFKKAGLEYIKLNNNEAVSLDKL